MKCFSIIVLTGALALPAGAMLVPAPNQAPVVHSDEDVQVAEGQIKSVDAERNTFVLATGEDGEEITLRATERTKFTLDGEESTMNEALKEGHDANVKHRNNLAIQVDATSRSAHAYILPMNADETVEVAEGRIVKVDAERDMFVLTTNEDGEEITLRVAERTQFTLDGEESTKEEALREGHDANVRHQNNLALRVEATTQDD